MNRIAVRTNKGEYVGGENVYGAVYLWICGTDPCRGVKLKFKGTEKCEWQYKEASNENGQLVEHVGSKVSKKELFRAEIRLIEYPDGIPMGCYVYPFQYTLKQGLPGSFHCNGVQHNGNKWSANTEYKVVAELDSVSQGDSLKSTQLITLNENLPLTSVDPEVATEDRTVKICCCIPRGHVLLNAWLTQKAYIAGEAAQLNVEVKNKSSVDIDSFIVKLVRVVKLKSQEHECSQSQEGKASLIGRMPVIVDNVSTAQQEGCPGNQDRRCTTAINLTLGGNSSEELQPTTNGSVIVCRYHVDAEMDIKWAEPISVQIPVILKAPRNSAWREWVPPGWVHNCKIVKITGTCAVAERLLGSKLFANIPGFQTDPF